MHCVASLTREFHTLSFSSIFWLVATLLFAMSVSDMVEVTLVVSVKNIELLKRWNGVEIRTKILEDVEDDIGC